MKTLSKLITFIEHALTWLLQQFRASLISSLKRFVNLYFILLQN